MKSISTITPAITENMEYMIVKAHAPVIDMKVGVSTVYHYASFCFQLFEHLANIPSKE